MRNTLCICIIALAWSSVATASDIAFYVGNPNVDGWYDVDSMNADVETIIAQTGQLFADVQKFNDDQFDAFGAWVDENTDDGEMDIIWLNGCVPSVLYQFPNVNPDGSRAEEWLDGGNMIINVGDWFAYCSYEGGSRQADNGATGAANILDLPSGVIVSADNTSLTVTPTGKEYLPSLGDTTVISYRPVALSAISAPWEVAAAFASTGGTDSPTEAQADPVVIHNTETGAYVAFINQSAGSGPPGWLDDRGLTCAEFIANWVAGVIGLGNPALALDPNPADEAVDVQRDVVLSWMPGRTAVTHDVYFGTSFDDVNNASRDNPLDVLVSQDQSENTYDPEGLLEFGTTYYWRIDEVNGAPDFTIFKGEVWSFTAEPLGYPITGITATSNATSDAGVGPERTIDGSGLNELDQHSTLSSDMWLGIPVGADPVYIQYEFDGIYKMHEMLVWNYNVQFELVLGFGLKDVTIEYSENGTDWTVLGEAVFAQATAKADYAANTTVDFGGVPAKFVKLTVNSGHGPMGQFGLSEVRFLFVPASAREPQPADGATGVLVDTTLTWRSGREAVTHDVYFGTDAEALELADSVGEPSYTPTLEFGNTYYWKIDEVNEADEVTVWPGAVWSFTAQEFAVVDDMESYDDEDNRIYDTWLDGFVNGTGSTVGYFEAPFAEQSNVNSGKQSMPLEYDNSVAPFYSEAELDVGSANWTTNGADTLQVFVAGRAPAFLETADGTIIMNSIGADIWGNADEGRYVHKQLTGNGSMVALVEDLDGASSGWAKAGVMIRQSTAVGSVHSFMCMTGGDGNGYSYQRRLEDNGASTSDNGVAPALAPPYWVRVERAADVFTASVSPDGVEWTEVGTAQTITMTDPVLIGLALTSHNAGMANSATFSNISTTGNVTGNWEIAEIGVAQPEGNIPEALYVAVEDASGNVAVATHPEAGATAIPGWTQWLIPYADLAGVNLSRVATLYVGIGDRDNPTAGGTGLIFVDDVGYGHPAAGQ